MELHEYEDLNQTVVPKGARVFRCCEDWDYYLVFTEIEDEAKQIESDAKVAVSWFEDGKENQDTHGRIFDELDL